MTDYAALSMTIDILYATEVADQTLGIMVTYRDRSAEEQIEYWLQWGDQNGLAPYLEARINEMVESGALTIAKP